VRAEKTLIKNEGIKKIEDSQALILTEYMGLSAEDMNELRKILREAEGDYQVVKNSIFKVSVKEKGLSFLEPYLDGPTGVAFVKEEDNVVKIAKVIKDFASKHNNIPKAKAGSINGEEINEGKIKELASLPSKEVLISQVIGGLNSMITGLVGVLNARVTSIVTVINAIKDKKEKEN
jgi:large subunit ribosomal protein L10